MPIALYPAYRTIAPDPSLRAYAHAYLALPFLPNGPTWFLWLLLTFSIVAALIFRFAPRGFHALGRLAEGAKARPGRFFLCVAVAGACGYVPLALAFNPWGWFRSGPFAFQYSRPLIDAVYFAAGVAVSRHGLERGLLAPDGALASRWRAVAAASILALFLWLGLAAMTMFRPDFAPWPMRFLAAVSYAFACACGVFFMLAIGMRFCAGHFPLLDLLSRNALGIYVLHYAPLVWMQFALMGAPLPAVVKASIVFLGVLLATLGAAILLRKARFGALLIGEEATSPGGGGR